METTIRQYFRHGADKLKPFEHVPNNKVYSFESDGEGYIFKLFRSQYWPENDKLQFVNAVLRQHKEYPNGYLIERKIEGVTADKITFTQAEEAAFYKQLATLVSEIHGIPLKGFGYIGNGDGGEDSMYACFVDEFDDRVECLEEKGVYTAGELQTMKEILMNTFKRFDDLPPDFGAQVYGS